MICVSRHHRSENVYLHVRKPVDSYGLAHSLLYGQEKYELNLKSFFFCAASFPGFHICIVHLFMMHTVFSFFIDRAFCCFFKKIASKDLAQSDQNEMKGHDNEHCLTQL